jgi:hypothetical protein
MNNLEKLNLNIKQFYFYRGADVNCRDDDFIAPIILASGSSGNAKTIEIMLHSKADILLSDREDCTALHIATKNNNIDAVKVI